MSERNFTALPGGAANAAASAIQKLMSQSQEAAPPGVGSSPKLVHQPGGDVLLQLKHPAFTTFEQLYRRLPREGWFSPRVNPQRPIQFELGSYTVPKDNAVWLTDYSFSVFRPSGIDAGDFQEAERGRFSNQLGFDLTIGNSRPGNIMYQLDPQPVQTDRTAFERVVSSRAPVGEFNRAASNSFASVAGQGTALLPVRRAVQGPPQGPFTFVVGPGRVIALSCVIFRRVRAPISCIQGRIAGFQITNTLSDSILQRLRPR